MNWNQSYNNNRDYLQLSTQSLTRLLETLGYTNISIDSLQALDIGCGTGQLARDLFHRGFTVTGIDTSETAIAIAEKSSIRKEVTFNTYDIEVDPLNSSFDLITCKYVLPFISNKERFLKNISRMMRTEAFFVIISPDPQYLPEAKQSIALSETEVKPLLKELFNDITKIQHKNDIWYVCRI